MKSLVWPFILMFLMVVTACSPKISDLKKEEMIGEKVTVTGTASNTFKLGSLQGFTLDDGNSTIRVASDSLPEENTKVTVTGVVIKDSLFGYYIKAEKVR